MKTEQLQIINKDTIKQLIGDNSHEIDSFYQQFLQQAKTSLKKLADYYQQSAFNELRNEAHYLKTSATAVGAERCSYCLQQLEFSSHALDKEQCKTHLQSLSHAIKEVFYALSHQSN
ncbi:Hpt domain-containing protein [Pseudoalteromonas ostreae]|uniref:Hpt domain-containing protein n=1 Tax=Pseudoalteromonas ostreae TaxID=2774154 RepID=UPI001B38526F|nr:Hpt domain-containing protein [Pseudoalteromonas ostreae]